MPSGDIFETPDGFAAFEWSPNGPGPRLWSSLDGTAWTVAPPPVQTNGRIEHAFVAGEHWIWSNDFRLWHSPDFVAWSEVDLTDFRPTPIAGFRLVPFSRSRPVTAGGTTLQMWEPMAFPEFAEILALPPEPGASFHLDTAGAAPALGAVLNVVHEQDPELAPVGRIRIDLNGSIVTITDVGRGVVASEIDAATLGQDARELAEHLLEFLDIHLPAVAVAVTDGVARPAAFLEGDRVLAALDGRFVGLTSGDPEVGESHLVWVSTDGQQWESLGVPDWPVLAAAVVTVNGLLEGAEPVASNTLTMSVIVEGAGIEQHTEIWSSDDAINWTRVGVLPPDNLNTTPKRVAGGYVALGDNDNRVYVSVDGTEWSPIDGLPEVGRLRDSSGGSLNLWTTRRVAFIAEDIDTSTPSTPNVVDRVISSLWFGAR